MKLIQKTTRFYLSYIFVLLTLAAILFYFLIRIVLIDSIDDGLKQEEEQIVNNLNLEKKIEELNPSENVFIEKLARLRNVNDKYTTINVYDSSKKKSVEYRQLKSVFAHKGEFYEIKIRHSLEEADMLLAGLLPMVVMLFLIILIGIYLMNNYLFTSLWEPFYNLLNALKEYDLNKSKVINYNHSDIQEFNELSLSVEKMTDKIYKDFVAQKEFNENSSHELQTPLSVIKNKLDLLIQSSNLDQHDLELISSMYESLKKLSNLNKGLILLNKIENRQYESFESVNLKQLILEVFRNFSDQIEQKELSVSKELSEYAIIKGNGVILEILLTNLISNAIRHNFSKGELKVFCTREFFLIENTGKELSEKPDLMFERFRKNSESSQSIGLGLAIVKKICDVFNYTIEYTNIEKIHSIKIYFKEHTE